MLPRSDDLSLWMTSTSDELIEASGVRPGQKGGDDGTALGSLNWANVMMTISQAMWMDRKESK